MEEPIRILHVLGGLNMGGAESRIMDLYRHIDRTKVQFDFLVHYKLKKEDDSADITTEDLSKLRSKDYFDDEVRALGGRIYVLPRFTGKNLGVYRKAVRAFFEEHHDFAAVEGHMTSMAGVYLPIAKACGVPVTIAHARSAGVDPGIRGVATRILRHNLANRCDVCFSCSKPASVSVFGKRAVREGKIQLIPNALDIRSFSFDREKRKKIRNLYGIPDEAVLIGHVGRFDAMKNQGYIAEICAGVLKERPDAPLYALFAGEGNLSGEVAEKFERAGMKARAFFPGNCDKETVTAMYQAFDVFVFPSLYEGLPGTVIEAQSAGLLCLISDSITDEVCLTESVRRLPLEDRKVWEKALIGVLDERKTEDQRKEISDRNIVSLRNAGYDIVTAAKELEAWYLACAQNKDPGEVYGSKGSF